MQRRRLASAPVVIGFLLFASYGVAAAAPRALLELFTSQGCSSCPPADKLLGEFAADPSVVALSLPIDMWDYLGWKDTLALPGHSVRQRAYARQRGDRQVYTPQMVVNGTTHVLGSDRAAIERAIAETDRDSDVMTVPVLLSAASGDLIVRLKAEPGAQAEPQAEPTDAEVWLCPVVSAIAVAIGRGENSGRTLTYHNVVRAWRKLGEYDGGESTWSVPLSQIANGHIDAAAVIVQKGTREKPGPVLGAALLPIANHISDDVQRTSNVR
jgi:hypothetical protein